MIYFLAEFHTLEHTDIHIYSFVCNLEKKTEKCTKSLTTRINL